jgi:hypothetical protein
LTERCGYLNVLVPPGGDARAIAAKKIEANGWTEPPYSFTYLAITGE